MGMANTRECHAHANVPIGDGAWRSGTTALVIPSTYTHRPIGRTVTERRLGLLRCKRRRCSGAGCSRDGAIAGK